MTKASNYTILEDFHEATHIPIFVYNANYHDLLWSKKLTITPDFPIKNYATPLRSLDYGAHVFSLGGAETVGTIIRHDFSIILWSNTQTITSEGYYEDSFPGINLERMCNYLKLLYQALFSKQATISTPKFDNSLSFVESFSNKTKYSYRSFASEKKLLYYLVHGDENKFNLAFKEFTSKGTYGIFSDNILRSKKNAAIIMTSKFSYAASSVGLTDEIVYKLRDRCIQKVESKTNIISIDNLVYEIGMLFFKLILSKKSDNSANIDAMINYIKTNIHKNLSVDDVISQSSYSKSRASAIFKEETGKTIIEYISEQKVLEAQSLLIFSNSSILDIAVDLGYGDQSYFTKVFSKYTGITPSKFRKKFHI